MTDRTTQLRLLMARHRLNGPAVAQLTGRSIHTVRSWMSGRMPIPDESLNQLRLNVDNRPTKVVNPTEEH